MKSYKNQIWSQSNITQLLLIIFYLLTFTSCGKKQDSGLEVIMTPKNGVLLDYDFETCSSTQQNLSATTPSRQYVKGPIVLFNKITLKWKNTMRLHVQSLNITFDSPQIKLNCTLPPNELAALFLFTNTTEAQTNSVVYDADGFKGEGTVTSYTGCKIACTATVEDKNNLDVSGSGIVTIKGTSESADGNIFTRVRATASVNVSP